MPLIYCVEDDGGIRELISCALRSGGYDVEAFPTARPFYAALEAREPALILLDIMLPQEDGMTVLRRLKADPMRRDIPVIMLTAKDSETDKVSGLESGADDYITKPFGVMETLSRIKAVLRRSARQRAGEPEIVQVGDVAVDVSRHVVTVSGSEITLTYKEFELLTYLMRNASMAISRDKLMEKVWGFEYAGGTRTVDMHIKTIRRKLESAGCTELIKTVRGVGYKCG